LYQAGMLTAAIATTTAGSSRRSPAHRRHQTAATGWSSQAMPCHRLIAWNAGGSSEATSLSGSASSGMPSIRPMLVPSGPTRLAAVRIGQRQASAKK
jgi:hypothetical protein